MITRRESIATTVSAAPASALFVVTAFFSAALVFSVEPMIARLVLPLMGGSPAVWNTSLAFFQAALLVGYCYAHLLQRLRSLGGQVLVHLAVLALAGVTLPLQVTTLFGEPSTQAPALWLLGVLVVSLGAPFAALSATAPLIQAWHARVVRGASAREPYVLYAASNVGSLVALVAYPTLVEPVLRLHAQTAIWTAAYGAFVLLAAALGAAVWRARPTQGVAAADPPPRIRTWGVWRERAIWLALAAVPSSLLLGVTTFITTDVGSVPFLWVAPLAFYLATFVIAFQARPAIRPQVALTLQAATVALCVVAMHSPTMGFAQQLAIHLTCFFLTALICHQALVARRPPAEKLTDFYFWMSLGGVIGGAFSAFLAPVIFRNVVEYPAMLIAGCLARPWGRGPITPWRWAGLAGVLSCCVLAVLLVLPPAAFAPLVAQRLSRLAPPAVSAVSLLLFAAAFAFLLQRRALMFAAAIALLTLAAARVTDQAAVLREWRGFFGVLRLTHAPVGPLGDTRMLLHGTTLHGAQSSVPAFRCRPLVYYAPDTPIGQVFLAEERRKSALAIGAVGLGTGAVAAYTRPTDSLRFFEIDPLVIRVATDPDYFTYVTVCARGRIAYTLGDARLTLARQAPGTFDILLIDAFSSDSVPTHLLTLEAVRMYLAKLAPDGVLILHLSNRNLDLLRPAQAAALAAGGQALEQFSTPSSISYIWSAGEQVVIVGRSRAALAPFLADPRWARADSQGVRAWTDDYTDLFGALVRRMRDGLRPTSGLRPNR